MTASLCAPAEYLAPLGEKPNIRPGLQIFPGHPVGERALLSRPEAGFLLPRAAEQPQENLTPEIDFRVADFLKQNIFAHFFSSTFSRIFDSNHIEILMMIMYRILLLQPCARCMIGSKNLKAE